MDCYVDRRAVQMTLRGTGASVGAAVPSVVC